MKTPETWARSVSATTIEREIVFQNRKNCILLGLELILKSTATISVRRSANQKLHSLFHVQNRLNICSKVLFKN